MDLRINSLGCLMAESNSAECFCSCSATPARLPSVSFPCLMTWARHPVQDHRHRQSLSALTGRGSRSSEVVVRYPAMGLFPL
jgi:hypothetical protein